MVCGCVELLRAVIVMGFTCTLYIHVHVHAYTGQHSGLWYLLR